jgi:DNA-binding NarL/FixJ family response regulator
MILFIDDETRRMDSFREELQYHFQVDFIDQVDRAYEFFQAHLSEIDLLILDIMMVPGKLFSQKEEEWGLTTGLHFYRLLREKAPNLPIIIFTNKEKTEKEFRGEPNCLFLRKRDYVPFELVDVVKEFLQECRVTMPN